MKDPSPTSIYEEEVRQELTGSAAKAKRVSPQSQAPIQTMMHLPMQHTRNLKPFMVGTSLDSRKGKQNTLNALSNISPTLALSSPTRDEDFQSAMGKIGASKVDERRALPTKSEEIEIPLRGGWKEQKIVREASPSDASIHVSNFKESIISMPMSLILPNPPKESIRNRLKESQTPAWTSQEPSQQVKRDGAEEKPDYSYTTSRKVSFKDKDALGEIDHIQRGRGSRDRDRSSFAPVTNQTLAYSLTSHQPSALRQEKSQIKDTSSNPSPVSQRPDQAPAASNPPPQVGQSTVTEPPPLYMESSRRMMADICHSFERSTRETEDTLTKSQALKSKIAEQLKESSRQVEQANSLRKEHQATSSRADRYLADLYLSRPADGSPSTSRAAQSDGKMMFKSRTAQNLINAHDKASSSPLARYGTHQEEISRRSEADSQRSKLQEQRFKELLRRQLEQLEKEEAEKERARLVQKQTEIADARADMVSIGGSSSQLKEVEDRMNERIKKYIQRLQGGEEDSKVLPSPITPVKTPDKASLLESLLTQDRLWAKAIEEEGKTKLMEEEFLKRLHRHSGTQSREKSPGLNHHRTSELLRSTSGLTEDGTRQARLVECLLQKEKEKKREAQRPEIDLQAIRNFNPYNTITGETLRLGRDRTDSKSNSPLFLRRTSPLRLRSKSPTNRTARNEESVAGSFLTVRDPAHSSKILAGARLDEHVQASLANDVRILPGQDGYFKALAEKYRAKYLDLEQTFNEWQQRSNVDKLMRSENVSSQLTALQMESQNQVNVLKRQFAMLEDQLYEQTVQAQVAQRMKVLLTDENSKLKSDIGKYKKLIATELKAQKQDYEQETEVLKQAHANQIQLANKSASADLTRLRESLKCQVSLLKDQLKTQALSFHEKQKVFDGMIRDQRALIKKYERIIAKAQKKNDELEQELLDSNYSLKKLQEQLEDHEAHDDQVRSLKKQNKQLQKEIDSMGMILYGGRSGNSKSPTRQSLLQPGLKKSPSQQSAFQSTQALRRASKKY